MKGKYYRNWSPFIKRGLLNRISNLLIGKVIGILFRKVEFDSESLINLNEYVEQGDTVFASFETSQTSLLIFTNLLQKHGIKKPLVGLGFVPYVVQYAGNFIRNILSFFLRFIKRKRHQFQPDIDSIKDILHDNSIVLSILSKRVFFRRYVEVKADTLSYLITIQKETERPIFIFPKMTFWNMNPERTRTLVTSRSTGDRGLLSGLFTIIKSRTPAFVRISAPINLKEVIEELGDGDPLHVAGLLRTRLLDAFHHDKRTVLGPVIKTRQEMAHKVLYHDNILNTIKELASEGNVPEKQLRGKALKYFREIAADFSINYVMVFEFLLRFIFRKVYDGIHYDTGFIRKLRDAAAKGPLIYLPCHRSHMDYLILSCILYQNKLISPHIVAGSNLTFFPMGKVFRRSGAFFIRRSFKGKLLYTAVLKQYIKTLINEEYSIEFFIEGGRTRTGKLVFPKIGIMKYLIEGIEEGYNRDLMFVPISINYERIMEESAYVKEHAGMEKKKETTSALVKSRKLLKKKYGRVFLEFGNPVSFSEITRDMEKGEDKAPAVADFIIKKINDIVLVTPSSMVTAAILFSPSEGFSRKTIRDKVVILHRYLMYYGARMSGTLHDESNYDEIMDYVFESYLDDHIIREDGDDIYSIREDQRVRINFYKNRIIHFFIPLSFTSISLMLLGENDEIKTGDILKNFNALADFFKYEFVYPELLDDRKEAVEKALSFLKDRSVITRNGNTIEVSSSGWEQLKFFTKIIQDYFESYLIVYSTAAYTEGRPIEKKDFIQEVRKVGISMYREGSVNLMESLSMSYYHNSLNSLISHKGLSQSGDEKKRMLKISNGDFIQESIRFITAYLDLIG